MFVPRRLCNMCWKMIFGLACKKSPKASKSIACTKKTSLLWEEGRGLPVPRAQLLELASHRAGSRDALCWVAAPAPTEPGPPAAWPGILPDQASHPGRLAGPAAHQSCSLKRQLRAETLAPTAPHARVSAGRDSRAAFPNHGSGAGQRGARGGRTPRRTKGKDPKGPRPVAAFLQGRNARTSSKPHQVTPKICSPSADGIYCR